MQFLCFELHIFGCNIIQHMTITNCQFSSCDKNVPYTWAVSVMNKTSTIKVVDDTTYHNDSSSSAVRHLSQTPHEQSQKAISTYPTCIRHSRWGWPHSNFTKIFGVRIRVTVLLWGVVCCISSQSGTIPTCDRKNGCRVTTYAAPAYSVVL